MRTSLVLSYLLSSSFQVTTAIKLNVHDVDSIKSAAKTIAWDLVSYYSGNETTSISTIASLPSPYWWWESGAMWGALIDYWHYTGDTTYNNITHTAILSQLGPDNDFMLYEQQSSEGNDDQAFWGFSAMAAAEKNFTAPPSGTPSWLQIVINLWNSQMWGALIDYWHYTGDTTYNNITHTAILSQLGPDNDFMLYEQQSSEGNDDQAFWGFSAMSAAEKNFTAPPFGTPSWLQIVINLWNSQMSRWDTTTCDGGMRWQIYGQRDGYDYKNSVTNGAFFQFSARLAHFTGNATYVAWAEKAFDWAFDIGLISEDYEVFDGTNDLLNCSEFDHTQWSYSHGIYLYGAAVMYNYTNGSAIWQSRTAGLLASISTFFTPYDNATNIMYEPSCEEAWDCNTDQLSFKAYLSRFLWSTAKIAPFTTDAIRVLLQTSAEAAAASCIGGTDGTKCGAKWYIEGGDGTEGAGQQMSALELIQGLLINETGSVAHWNSVHFTNLTTLIATSNQTNQTNSTMEAPVPSPTILVLSGASSTSTTMASSSAVGMVGYSNLVWLASVAVFVILLI